MTAREFTRDWLPALIFVAVVAAMACGLFGP